MPLHNADIAAVYTLIADLQEIEVNNPFRVRACRNTSRMIGELPRDVAAALRRGEELPKVRARA
jgi:DNA polymerase (family X)